VPPSDVDETDATATFGGVEEQLAQARAELTTCQERLKQATGNLAAAEATVRSAEVDLKRARASLAEVLKVGDPSTPDDELMAPLSERAEGARQKLEAAEKKARQDRSVADTRAAQVESKQQMLAESRRVLNATSSRLAKRHAQCLKDCAGLSLVFRPNELGQAEIAAALERVRGKLSELRSYERGAQEARTDIQNTEGRETILRSRREQEIDGPRREIGADLATLRERISRAVEFLDFPDGVPPEIGDQKSLAGDLLLAQLLEARGARLLDVVRQRSKEAKDESANAGSEAAEILADLNMARPEELQDAIVAAAMEAQLAANEHATAEAQQPRAAVLDKVIGQGLSFVTGLDELGHLLTDGRFIGELVTRKQTILLRLASDILGSITTGTYGFAEDFEVLDRGTGQPRSAKTLSGGEKFLASLSLALALVELAGRSGGRLEALFLDEGFGSLDMNSLDDALNELERRAASGRLVAVVSHIRSVAERIENVLLVTKTAAGSSVRWAADNESDVLIQETVEGGLLA